MALCGVAETPQINCHSWPFLSHFFFAPPLPDSFFLPPFFLPPGYNWGSLYGLIKQPPPSTTSPPPRHHWLAPLSETLYEKCMPLFKCIGSAHRHPGLFVPPTPARWSFKKKFQNIGEKRAPASGIVLAGPASKHIWLQTYCFLRDPSNVAARISTVLFFLVFFTATHSGRKECNLANKCCDRQLVWRILWLVCAAGYTSTPLLYPHKHTQ